MLTFAIAARSTEQVIRSVLRGGFEQQVAINNLYTYPEVRSNQVTAIGRLEKTVRLAYEASAPDTPIDGTEDVDTM
jgi:hypothetical protein